MPAKKYPRAEGKGSQGWLKGQRPNDGNIEPAHLFCLKEAWLLLVGSKTRGWSHSWPWGSADYKHLILDWDTVEGDQKE